MKVKAFIFKAGMTGKKKDESGEYTTLSLYQIEEKKDTGERYLGFGQRSKAGDDKKGFNTVRADENLFFMYAPVEMPIVKELFFGDIVLVKYDVSDSGTLELVDVEELLYESPYRDFPFSAHAGGAKVHAALRYRQNN